MSGRRIYSRRIAKLRNDFAVQKWRAARRGIKFLMTFEEWLEVWEQSGKLMLRGRGRGKYCMARFGDKGPYKVGNVEIITHEKNSTDQQKTENGKRTLRKLIAVSKNPTAETRRKLSLAGNGKAKPLNFGSKISAAWQRGCYPILKGEDNNASKLTNREARQIRRLYAQGWLYRELAARFGVCRSTIGNIVTGAYYAE